MTPKGWILDKHKEKGQTGYVLDAMDEYAEQQVIEFQKWTNLSGWFWTPNRWVNYHGDPNPKSTTELYQLFKQQVKQ